MFIVRLCEISFSFAVDLLYVGIGKIEKLLPGRKATIFFFFFELNTWFKFYGFGNVIELISMSNFLSLN